MSTYRVVLAATLASACGLLLQAGAQTGGTVARSAAGAQQGADKARANSGSAAQTLGKKIFVEKCASCHGEDGAKPLEGGSPLSERKLSDEQLTKNVRGRLKSFSEDQQRAVAEYIRSFQKK